MGDQRHFYYIIKLDFQQFINVETMVFGTLGVIAGGLITWFVAKHYYVKAGKELLAESDKLRLLSNLILYKLQHPETITEIKYNEAGDIVGLTANTSGSA